MGLRHLAAAGRQLIIDGWGWLNYKPIFASDTGMPSRRAFPESTAMWVPPADQRRLAAYKILAAYDNNQAGQLAAIADGPEALERREFGDPAMFIDTLVADVLGSEQTITVPGADHDGDGEPSPEQAMAERVQGLLREWAEDELLPMRMLQAERKAVCLGDGVYWLALDASKGRPVLRVTDPGFYFPVIEEDGDTGAYPRRVHLAWELPEDQLRGLKPRLRRITWELDYIRPLTAPGVDQRGRAVRAPVMQPPDPDGETDPGPILVTGDTLDPASGSITRNYAWNDRPSPFTCYMTDATWRLSDLTGPTDVDALPLEKAAFATRGDGEVLDHLDLLIDFIPVVHVPNTVPDAEEHWGQSSLAKVLQVFDELAGADTDSSHASAITGSPILSITTKGGGGKQPDRRVEPGVVFDLPEGGRMDALNTAPQLAGLREHVRSLQDRAAATARLPAVSLGTADPAAFPSGYALELALGPEDSLMAFMRLARFHKYKLLLKFVQRLHLAGQFPKWAGVTVQSAVMTFGPYRPLDKKGILDQVIEGVQGHVISLETGVRMLMEAGFPIQDVQKEIERIQARAFADAKNLADATGDTEAVGRYLGINVTQDTPPAPELPPVPSADPAPSDQSGGSGS
ncbi:hypothetical protein OG552_10410 [Streptomyces sp. NBC_01476]|uniref:hypothetical protein n=1 Tax=Streptomyces sp. NBC_01476 TaxID=2903881 RepID=UPI002E32FBEE|nr:hypothetical protein [Streptomyces sp. NBC_01476]